MRIPISIFAVAAAAALVGFSGVHSGAGATGVTGGTGKARAGGTATTAGTTGTADGSSTGSTAGSTGSTAGSSAGTTAGGTTAGTTSGGTGTTGGGPPGNQPWYPLCRIERIEEFKSKNTYAYSGSTQNVHVARAILQVAGPPQPPYGSTTVMYNGQPVNCPWILDNYSYVVGAESPTQEGDAISGTTIAPVPASVPIAWTSWPPPNGTWTYVPGVNVALPAYGEVPIQISASGPFSPINTTLNVSIGFHANFHYVDPNTGSNVVTHWPGTYANYTFNFVKMPLNGSAIDTRRAYGISNLAGELTADPNAPPRNLWFNPWIYTGGCFVGNMPYTSGTDQSGLSRMQMWANYHPTDTCLAATATMLDMGARTTPTGIETVGIFIPADSSPAQIYQQTWANAWNVNPVTTRPSPVNYSQWPVSTLTLGASNTGDYLNWLIADTYNNGYVIPPAVLANMCFALTDETTGPTWHYFASSAYSAQATTFPGNDSVPRLWYIGMNTYSTWSGPF